MSSSLVHDIEQHLRKLDPQKARHFESLVRELVALTEPDSSLAEPPRTDSVHLADLIEFAEPMGSLTNEEIDKAIYGE